MKREHIIGGLASLPLLAGIFFAVNRQNSPPVVRTSRENPIMCTVYDADRNLDFVDIYQDGQPIARYNIPRNQSQTTVLNLLDIRVPSDGLPPIGDVKIIAHDRRGATGEGTTRIPGKRS